MANSNVVLVTGSYDHTLIFWDAITGQNISTFDYPDNQIINRIEISSDKNYLGAAGSSFIKIYDIPSQSATPTITYDQYTTNVTQVGFQKDCKWIYASSEDGSIKVFDLRASGYQRTYQNKEPINSLILHPNEAELIAGDQFGNLKIYDLTADSCRTTIKPAPEIGIRSISIDYNASLLVAADSAGICHVWYLKNGEELVSLQEFRAHNDYILKCLISPNLKFLATCSADKTIKIWEFDQNKGYSLYKTLYGHSKWVWDVAFSCDTDFLISVSSDCFAKIWQTETGETMRVLKSHKKGINCLALNDTN